MKKLLCILISILCVASLLCACSKKTSSEPSSDVVNKNLPLDSNIVGTWLYVDAEGNPHSDMGGWIFNEDKTGVDTVFDLSFTYETDNGMLEIKYDDTTLGEIETLYEYKIKDSLLTMKRYANGAESFTYKKDTAEQQTN